MCETNGVCLDQGIIYVKGKTLDEVHFGGGKGSRKEKEGKKESRYDFTEGRMTVLEFIVMIP